MSKEVTGWDITFLLLIILWATLFSFGMMYVVVNLYLWNKLVTLVVGEY